MSQADEIRQELERRNKETRQKIKKQRDEKEFREYLDDLGIERIDAPKKEKKLTHSGRRSRK